MSYCADWRAIAAILRAAAGLDREQGRDLHLGGIEMRAGARSAARNISSGKGRANRAAISSRVQSERGRQCKVAGGCVHGAILGGSRRPVKEWTERGQNANKSARRSPVPQWWNGRRGRLKICCRKACWFKSGLHHRAPTGALVLLALSFSPVCFCEYFAALVLRCGQPASSRAPITFLQLRYSARHARPASLAS